MALEGEIASWREFRGSLRGIGSSDFRSIYEERLSYCNQLGSKAFHPRLLVHFRDNLVADVLKFFEICGYPVPMLLFHLC
jgi:hypothetical protein